MVRTCSRYRGMRDLCRRALFDSGAGHIWAGHRFLFFKKEQKGGKEISPDTSTSVTDAQLMVRGQYVALAKGFCWGNVDAGGPPFDSGTGHKSGPYFLF
jgi:hypothetical protein